MPWADRHERRRLAKRGWGDLYMGLPPRPKWAVLHEAVHICRGDGRLALAALLETIAIAWERDRDLRSRERGYDPDVEANPIYWRARELAESIVQTSDRPS